jgi:hypothetical protein
MCQADCGEVSSLRAHVQLPTETAGNVSGMRSADRQLRRRAHREGRIRAARRRLKERVAGLETQANNLPEKASLETDLRLIIGHLEDFAATMTATLDHLDWEAQRGIIRMLVKRVEIEQGQVNVVFRLGPGPLISGPDPTSLHYCGRGARASLPSPCSPPNPSSTR